MRHKKLLTFLTVFAMMLAFASCDNERAAEADSDSSYSEKQAEKEQKKEESRLKREKVTKANETAASMKNSIDVILTDFDTVGAGMKLSDDSASYLKIRMIDGVWSAELSDTSCFKSGKDQEWKTSGAGIKDDSASGIYNLTAKFAIMLAKYQPDITDGSVLAYLKRGRCTCLAFSDETTDGLIEGRDIPYVNGDGVFRSDTEWCDENGVSLSGIVVGTAPVTAPEAETAETQSPLPSVFDNIVTASESADNTPADTDSGKDEINLEDLLSFGMSDYIKSSKITSANATAASVRNGIETFLIDADLDGYGMLYPAPAFARIEITITDGTWDMMLYGTDQFGVSGEMEWMPNGTGEYGRDTENETNITSLLASRLADSFPEIREGSVRALLCEGRCLCIAYTSDSSAILRDEIDIPEMTANGWASDSFAWDGKTAGMTPDGIVVGTYPVVPLG